MIPVFASACKTVFNWNKKARDLATARDRTADFVLDILMAQHQNALVCAVPAKVLSYFPEVDPGVSISSISSPDSACPKS
jgi:hypothetical protein